MAAYKLTLEIWAHDGALSNTYDVDDPTYVAQAFFQMSLDYAERAILADKPLARDYISLARLFAASSTRVKAGDRHGDFRDGNVAMAWTIVPAQAGRFVSTEN